MVISTVIGKGACGSLEINSGDLGCSVNLSLIKHAIFLKKGTRIPVSTDLNEAYMSVLTQAGAVPLIDAYGSEPTFADDTLETSDLGVEALTLKGLPKFSLTFKKGQEFYKQLSKLTGFDNYEVILGDVNGNWVFALASNGDLKGFDVGQIVAMMTAPASASETEKKTISFQLTSRPEYDLDFDVILASNAFPIYDNKGVNGVTLSFEDVNGAVPPADLATTLKVKAVFTNGGDVGIEGLAVGNFLYTVDGSTVTPSGVVDDGNGFYTFTVAAIAAAEVLLLQNYDSSANKNVVITSAGVLLRSNILSAIAVA